MDAAIRAARAQATAKPLSIVTEYPAHLPAVQGEGASVADAIGAMIRTVSAFTDRGEVRVRAELLTSGEVPATFAEVAGHPEGVVKGGPWAVVSVQSAQGRIPADTLQALYAGKSLRAGGVRAGFPGPGSIGGAGLGRADMDRIAACRRRTHFAGAPPARRKRPGRLVLAAAVGRGAPARRAAHRPRASCCWSRIRHAADRWWTS